MVNKNNSKMKILLIFLSLLFVFTFSKGQQHKSFIPDTMVIQIKINDIGTTEAILGKNIWQCLFESKGNLPRIELINKTKNQSLRLIFHYGGSKNSVDEFEILKIDSFYKIPTQAKVLKIDTFVTGNGIKLGISKDEIVRILGNNYKSNAKGKIEELLYTLDSKAAFVKRYNQFEYYIRCLFKNGILVKYSFGFVDI
jgi:hypothetical protein